METTDTNLRIHWPKEVLLWLALAAPLAIGILLWNDLPDQMPIHWNVTGEPDGFASKFWGVAGLVLINVFTYVVLLVAPRIDPRRRNSQAFFSGPYFLIRLGIVLFLTAIHIGGMLAATQDGQYPMPKIIVPAVFFLFVVLGNFMTTVRSNYFFGIRTPWTLESEEVWKRTHRLAGKLWFWVGLAGLVVSFFLSQEQGVILIVVVALAIAVIPAVYSYRIYYKLKQQPGV